MTDNIALASKCMDVLCKNVGIVEAERFICYIKSEAFDYTKWQRDYYDSISESVLKKKVKDYNASNPFQGEKAVRI